MSRSRSPARKQTVSQPQHLVVPATTSANGFRQAALAGRGPRIYVGSLDYNISEREVMQVFSAFGEVLDIDMPREGLPPHHKGFCFVQMASPRAAALAVGSLSDFVLAGRRMKVGWQASPKDGSFASRSILGTVPLASVAAANSRRVAVSGIPARFGPVELKLVFQAFGAVARCDMVPATDNPSMHCGRCMLEFATEEAARTAIAALQGFELGGARLRAWAPDIGADGAPVLLAQPASAAPEMGSASTAAVPLPCVMPAAVMPVTVPEKPKKVMTSPVLAIDNLVAPGDVDDDLADEVQEEAAKSGKVEEVKVFEGGALTCVRVFVRFASHDAVAKAVGIFDKRWFAGRRVRAKVYPEDSFKNGTFDAEPTR